MTERLCTWDDANPEECGKPTEEYLQLYTEWAKGQIGITILGNIPCDRRYPEAKRNAIIDPLNSWDAVAAFRPVIQAAKANRSLVLGQVTHAGRVSAQK
jgi:2,4-dienoyl-CoA reductase-like NADH-dependent reductase (Old Yellow Enzyme family)